MKKVTSWALVLGLISFMISYAVAAPPPPEGVGEIIEEMGRFEESFESENWGEAEESIGKMERELKEIFAQSKINDTALEKRLAGLAKFVKVSDHSNTETNYILFQKQYFDYLSNFQYEIHPILTMIKQYVVDEASEALEKKDYDDIVSEMREAANLIDHAKPILVEKGISEDQVVLFKSKVIETIKAGRAHDANQVRELLKEIEGMYSSFLEQYKAA